MSDRALEQIGCQVCRQPLHWNGQQWLHADGTGTYPHCASAAPSLDTGQDSLRPSSFAEMEVRATVALDSGDGSTRRACNNENCSKDYGHSEPCDSPQADAARIGEIGAREEKATKGPWLPDIFGLKIFSEVPDSMISGSGTIFIATMNGSGLDRDQCESNVLFAAHAREDIPYLLAEVERLRGERDALQKQLVDMESAFFKEMEQIERNNKA